MKRKYEVSYCFWGLGTDHVVTDIEESEKEPETFKNMITHRIGTSPYYFLETGEGEESELVNIAKCNVIKIKEITDEQSEIKD